MPRWMPLAFPEPRFMPCSECGASVARAEVDEHECDDERLLDYRVFHHREELAAFEAQLGSYLGSPRGRFELWYASQRRHAA